MKTRAAILAAVALIPLGAQANLLANGSFEDGTTGAMGQYAAIPGWTAEVDTIEVGLGNLYGVTGYDGKNVVELDSNENSTISQSVQLVGGEYDLTFAYAARANTSVATNKFRVYWNDDLLAGFMPSATSMTYVDIPVDAIPGLNKLTFVATGTSDGVGGILDDVALSGGAQAVPEPASVAGLGLGLLAFVRLRRKA